KQQLVITGIQVIAGELLFIPVIHQVKLTTEYGFNAMLFGLCRKTEYSKHIAMVSDGKRFHAICFGLFHESSDVRCPVKKGILCVNVEMIKGRHLEGN